MISLTMSDHDSSQSASGPLNAQAELLQNAKTSSRSGPRIYHKKKAKISKKDQRNLQKEGLKISMWKLNENVAYMQYLMENEQLFYSSRFERKAMKINVLMSEAIRTRSADQCRSHHQKMIKYHRDIPNIILHIQSLVRRQQSSTRTPPPNQIVNQPQGPPLICSQQMPRPIYDDIVFPDEDLESWINRYELAEQERQIEVWLQGVEDKYGNL